MGVWSYGVYNLGHILGISLLFGSIVVLDLRLLGLWRGIGLSTIATPVVPLAALGFSAAAISGICMISTNATPNERTIAGRTRSGSTRGSHRTQRELGGRTRRQAGVDYRYTEIAVSRISHSKRSPSSKPGSTSSPGL